MTRSDLIRLQENVFVNDTIIDFYLRRALIPVMGLHEDFILL